MPQSSDSPRNRQRPIPDVFTTKLWSNHFHGSKKDVLMNNHDNSWKRFTGVQEVNIKYNGSLKLSNKHNFSYPSPSM